MLHGYFFFICIGMYRKKDKNFIYVPYDSKVEVEKGVALSVREIVGSVPNVMSYKSCYFLLPSVALGALGVCVRL